MTEHATLTWGIKQSLLEYVESLEDGVIEATAPATREDAQFSFSLNAAASDFNAATNEGMLQFSGSVIMTGYWGSMRIEIHDPRLRLSGTSGDLLVRVKNVIGADRLEQFALITVTATQPELKAEVTLAPAGRMMLGQQYSVGQSLDELTVKWQ